MTWEGQKGDDFPSHKDFVNSYNADLPNGGIDVGKFV